MYWLVFALLIKKPDIDMEIKMGSIFVAILQNKIPDGNPSMCILKMNPKRVISLILIVLQKIKAPI